MNERLMGTGAQFFFRKEKLGACKPPYELDRRNHLCFLVTCINPKLRPECQVVQKLADDR